MKRTFAHIGFSFGVTLVMLNFFGAEFAKWAGVVILALFATSLAIPEYRRAASVPVCAGSALFACVLFLYAYYNIAVPQLNLDGQKADVMFYITGLGQKTAYGYSYPAKTVGIGISGAPQNIRINLYTNEPITAAGYQLLEGKLKFNAAAQNGFDSFGSWGKGIFVKANSYYINRTDEFVASPMRKILELRYHIITFYQKRVGGDEGALAIGILTGDRSHMSDELNNAFKMTGTTHLTALSGLHLGAVTGVFAFVFKKLRVSSKISSPVLLGIIVFYSMLGGFSKSLIRAGIMLGVILIGNMINRRADALNSLGFALFCICLNPFAVCDASTLFTVVCVLAIIVVFPFFENKNYDSGLNKGLKINTDNVIIRSGANALVHTRNMLVLSVCIAVCCLPINCMLFGYFSLVGMLLNVIIIPLGTVAVVLSVFSVILGVPVGVKLVNGVIIRLVTACAGLPFATVNTGWLITYIIAFAMILTGISIIVAPKLSVKTAVICSVIVLLTACVLDFCIMPPVLT